MAAIAAAASPIAMCSSCSALFGKMKKFVLFQPELGLVVQEASQDSGSFRLDILFKTWNS